MIPEQKLLLDIKKKRNYLKKRLNETNDSIERKVIAFSICSYLQMEYSLSKINFYVDKIEKVVLKRDSILEKSISYIKILDSNLDYWLSDLDLDYVSSLTGILSERIYCPIPITLNVSNRDLIDISEQFYNECFEGEIRENGLDLLKNSTVFFPSLDFYCSDVIGKNYTDLYFGDNYSFIKRQNNDLDFVSVPHEVFHGVHSKINPQALLHSIPETGEIGSNAIEFILYDFLDQLYGSVGSGLKKLALFNIGLDAFLLKEKIFEQLQNSNSVTSFLDFETKIVGYGIYKLYKEDRRKGEEKLIELAKCSFSCDKLPDYSSLGFSKEVILSFAQMMVEERNTFIFQQRLDSVKNKKA